MLDRAAYHIGRKSLFKENTRPQPLMSCLRRATERLVLSIILLLALLPASLAQAEQEQVSLCDRYFFYTSSELLTAGGGRLRGSRGAIVERKADDAFSLVSGEFTVTCLAKPLTISAGELNLRLPVNSNVSLRLGDDCALTVHKTDAAITVSGAIDGKGFNDVLSERVTVPPGATAVKPVELTGSTATPLFFVGTGAFLQNTSHAVALKSGQMFICPPQDIDILTSLGVVKAKAHSRFFLSLADSASSIGLLNCSSSEIVFYCGKKYRHIRPFEEFRFYDHRPTREEVLPADGLGRKEVVLHDIEEQRTASTNSFLLTSMLASPYYLGKWQRNSAFDKKMLKALLKSQAAYDSVSPSAEQFYVAPDLYKGLH